MNTMANQAMHCLRVSASAASRWLAGAAMAAMLAACGGGGGDNGRDPILGGGGVAELAPVVTAVVPIQNSVGVPTNTRVISASFSKPMDVSTINATNFTLACPVGTAITGVVSYAPIGNVAILTLSNNLPTSTTCTGTVSTGVKDVSGNPLARPFVWTFTTGAAPDTTPPTVSSTFPTNNATGVAVNAVVTVSFSEPMDPLSITSTNVRLACPATTPITATVGYTVLGNVATLIPASSLPANTICTGSVTTAVRDVAGNTMLLPFVWTFTTGGASDTAPPTVIATFPLANATGVPVNSIVTATFSKAMNPLTITTANVKLVCPASAPVIGTVGYAVNGSVMTFIPLTNLPVSTQCTATISTGVKDVAGNAMAADFVWSFTTGAAPDVIRPTVTAVIPRAGAVSVATNTLVTASFSEPMNPLTINSSTMMLTCPGLTPIVGTVGYASLGTVATFTPTTALPFNAVCTATVTNGVTDVAGNSMAVPFIWTFTTAAAADAVPPTVISTLPINGAVGVALGATSSATFSEPMDPLTMTPATFRLACPTVNLTGSVSYSVAGNTVSFKPANDMPANTLCTATITTGVRDTSGNAMLANYVWQFTTQTVSVPPVPPAGPIIALGSAAAYGAFGGSAGITNQGLLSIVNGSIGTTAVSTAITGFHSSGPGCIYTETPLNAALVTGAINTAAPPPTVACPSEGTAVTFAAATAARADALAAYNQLVAQPGGPDPGAGNLGSLTLAPGVYTAVSGSFRIQGGNLTLDAQGNANAVWIFQMATTLTVGGPGAAFPQSIILANGAQAKNVFWQVGSAATINAGGGGTMAGTIIAQSGVAISTAGNVAIVTVNGRALSLGAAVTIVNTVINVPGP